MTTQPQHYLPRNQPVHHEIVTLAQTVADASPINPAMDVAISYDNNLGTPVTVVMRTGMTARLNPSHRRGPSAFSVRYRLSLAGDVNLDMFRLSNANTPEGRLLKDALEYGDVYTQRRRRYADITYVVTREELLAKNGSLYLDNLDIVVSLLQDELVPHHPHSVVGIRNRLVQENDPVNRVDCFGYSLQIVDNHEAFGARYVNINNRVYKVPAVSDPERPDGVYRVSSPEVQGDFDHNPPVSQYYKFDQLESAGLGLYASYQEALTLGDQLGTRKAELEVQSHELKQQEVQLKHERMERESEFDRRKQALEEIRHKAEDLRKSQEIQYKFAEQQMTVRQTQLKHELSELEYRRDVASMRHKDHYELRSYERKDSSEFLKVIPAVIAGVAAIVLAFKKFG